MDDLETFRSLKLQPGRTGWRFLLVLTTHQRAALKPVTYPIACVHKRCVQLHVSAVHRQGGEI